MKKRIYLLVLLIGFFNCNTETPVKFTEAALSDTFVSLDGESIVFKDILKAHKGKSIVIDIWASWCSDCIKGMSKVRDLQESHPEVAFVFLSLDRGQAVWKRGVEKYEVQGEHYYLPLGKESAFGDFVNIDWIPRYMVVDSHGNIKMFKAIEADDQILKQNL